MSSDAIELLRAHEREAAQVHLELQEEIGSVRTDTLAAIREVRAVVRAGLPYTSLSAALGGAAIQFAIWLFGG